MPIGITQAFVARREPRMDPIYFGQDIQLDNVPVQVSPQGSPDPIRQSQYVGIGRAPTQRQAGVNIALHMNIAGIQGVMEDTFLAGKVLPQRLTLMGNGLGGQAAWTERQNIGRGDAAPYGNRVQIVGEGQVPLSPVDGYGLMYSRNRRRV